jgi:hypothetical protein
LSANVNQEFMNRAQQAAGLFGTGAGLLGQGYQTQQAALAPFQSTFQTQQALEEEARRPMDIGSALGAKTSTAGATAGQMMMGGQQAAGALQQQAASAKAAQLAGMGQGIAGLGQQYYQQQQYNDTLDKILSSGMSKDETQRLGTLKYAGNPYTGVYGITPRGGK